MALPPLVTPEEPPCTGAFGEVSLTSGVRDVILLALYSSRAQLLLLTLSLACLGKTELQFPPFDKLQLLSPGAHLSPTSVWMGLAAGGVPDSRVARALQGLC